jgi:hypothetical protein
MGKCHHLSYILPVLSQVNAHIVDLDYHVAKFVNLYTKASVFLRNVLLENNSPFEQHSEFIYR